MDIRGQLVWTRALGMIPGATARFPNFLA